MNGVHNPYEPLDEWLARPKKEIEPETYEPPDEPDKNRCPMCDGEMAEIGVCEECGWDRRDPGDDEMGFYEPCQS